MQKYVVMMTRAVIIFINTCLILEVEKSEYILGEDILSILKPSEITKIQSADDVVVGPNVLPRLIDIPWQCWFQVSHWPRRPALHIRQERHCRACIFKAMKNQFIFKLKSKSYLYAVFLTYLLRM